MQAQAAPIVWDWILFWLMTGVSLLGLPPGERDPRLISAAPPKTIAYFDWAGQSAGKEGASGVDGFAADPEIRQLVEQFDAALAKRKAVIGDDEEFVLRAEWPQLARLIAKHPGCLFLGFEPRPANKPGPEDWINRLMGFHGGAILSVGDDADVVWVSLMRLFESIPDANIQSASSTQNIPLPIPGYQLVAHRDGQRILFALGDATLQRMIDGLSGKIPGLDTNPRFRDAFDRIHVPRVSTLGWIDGQEALSTVNSLLGPAALLARPILTLVGADAVDRAIQVSGVENDTMVQRSLVITGGRTDGLMTLFSGFPIQPASLSHIPADADMVIVASISLKNIYQETRNLLTFVHPLSVKYFDEIVKQLEAELELKIVDDLLPAFGDVVTAFDSPSAGGMIASSVVFGIEVRDHAKAERVLDNLLSLVNRLLTADQSSDSLANPVIGRQLFAGQTLYTVEAPGYGFESPAPPVWTMCLTDGHLLFSLHPQAMKAELRFLASQRPLNERASPATFGQIAWKKIANPQGDVLCYAYLNGPRAYGLLTTLLPSYGPTFLYHLELEGVSLNSFSLPSAAAILPYFGDSTAVLSRRVDGLSFETQNAPPVVASLALLSLYRSWQGLEPPFLEEARRDLFHKLIVHQPAAAKAQTVPATAKSGDPKIMPAKSERQLQQNRAPSLIKSLIPSEAQSVIPDSIMRRIEEGPSPDAQKRRDEAWERRQVAKQKRDDMRRRRDERRHP